MLKKSVKILKILAVFTTAVLLAVMMASLSSCAEKSGKIAENDPVSTVTQQQAGQTAESNSTSGTSVAENTAAEEQAAGPVTVTDGLGNEITLDRPAEKVIVFTPSALEIINALGSMNKVIGVDSWSIDSGEPLAKGFEGFGDFQSLNMEKITAASPDLIIGLVGWAEADLQKLSDLGIKMYIVEANTMDEVYTEIRNMGAVLGRNSEAKALEESLKNQVYDITSKIADIEETEKPKVFYEVWNDPLMSAGGNTFINDLINMAGGINIVEKDGLEGWPEYSIEKLVQNNPDVIIAPVSLAPDASVILSDAKLSKTSAIINKRVYIVPDNPVTRPSQNIIKGLTMLAKAFHPDIFGEFETIN